MSLALAHQKQALRRAALTCRDALDEAARAAAAIAVVPAARALVKAHAAGPVALFSSIGSEIDTAPLAAALAAAGFELALPVMAGATAPLQFRRWRPGEALVPGHKGIGEPPETAAAVVPSLVFVPFAAFDRRGFRIGYGAGYYDRTLVPKGGGGVPFAVGLGFAAQEVAAIPDQPHDVRLDAVVTERETIFCRS